MQRVGARRTIDDCLQEDGVQRDLEDALRALLDIGRFGIIRAEQPLNVDQHVERGFRSSEMVWRHIDAKLCALMRALGKPILRQDHHA